MEIYPQRQLAMFLAAVCLGASMGAFRVLLQALCTLVGAYAPPEHMRARYARSLPFLHVGVRFEEGKTRRIWRVLVVFAFDLFFCLFFCVSLILLFYCYNDGAWRLSVPLCSFVGLWVFCLLSRRFFARANDYLAYFLAVTALYIRAVICLPPKWLWRLCRRFLLRPILGLWRGACEKRRRARTQKLCRAELALAARGKLI